MDEPAPAGNGHLSEGAVLSKLAWGLRSDPGKVRETNEDYAGAYAPTIPDDAWDRGPLFAVADGLGGHAAGEVASRLAVEAILRLWTAEQPAEPVKALRAAARQANTAVLDASFAPQRAGMATTLTALTLAGREALIVHVGDSRAYLVRGGSCRQLTADHTRVGEMLRMKLLSPEQAATHPARSQLTRTIGSGALVQVDIVRQPVESGDTLILCSDGLWSELSHHELAELATGHPNRPTPADAASALVDEAVGRGAADNVTAVVVRVTSGLPIPSVGAKRRSLFRRGGS